MEPSIYSFSLCTALPLMLFFGFYFLFAKTPEKKIFKNYLRSRQMMGIAMLLLSANYSVHFFFGIRFKNADSAILMNMSTYFLCYSLFSSACLIVFTLPNGVCGHISFYGLYFQLFPELYCFCCQAESCKKSLYLL